MATALTPAVTSDTSWQSQSNLQRKISTQTKQSPSKISPINMQDFIENLNEMCYRGFDELNALIQEQRWVQSYLNLNSSSSNSPLVNVYGGNSCSARVLIIPEYFIFKCKKIESTVREMFFFRVLFVYDRYLGKSCLRITSD